MVNTLIKKDLKLIYIYIYIYIYIFFFFFEILNQINQKQLY